MKTTEAIGSADSPAGKERRARLEQQTGSRSFVKTLAPSLTRWPQAQTLQRMELDDLIAAIFNHVGEPISVDDLVSIIADIKGIKDLPAISFDSDENVPARNLSDSRLRIDKVLEMREPLKLFWEGLCQLPPEEFKVYILYARDTTGEDIISLFLAARIISEPLIAQLLGLTIEKFQELWLNSLPLDNESIARELGIKIERVYKLRFQAGKRLRKFLSAKQINI